MNSSSSSATYSPPPPRPTSTTRKRRRDELERYAIAAEREAGRRSLAAFVRMAWPTVEPGRRLAAGWHLDAITEHLQAVTDGQIKKLVINVPPRMTKSLTTAVFWPAWEWTRDASVRWLFTSHRHDLSLRDNVRARRLIESPWYQARWPHVQLEHDQNQKGRYETTAGGYRLAASFGGTATGDGGQRRVVDDPHNAHDVMSDLKREADIEWWRDTWTTRFIEPETDADVVIMQRLHERDLSGFLLAEVGGYEHLMLPMRFEPERRCTTSIGFVDPRRHAGELLDPVRFPEAVVATLEVTLGEYGTAGQLQQRPAPVGGGMVKTHWFRYWVDDDHAHLGPVRVKDPDGNTLEVDARVKPPTRDADHVIQSWDMAFKATKGSSRVAGQVWEQHGADAYLIDNRAERLSFTETIAAVRRMSSDHPEAYTKLVEDKANGPAVIDSLQHELGGFVPIQPIGGKEARMAAVTPRIEAGNVYLPHPGMRPWAGPLRDRLAVFPAGESNDEADAFSQALEHLPRTASRYDATKQPPRSVRVSNPRRR